MASNNDRGASLPSGANTSMTFAMAGEDHTLGNALRSLLAGRMDVEFVGYSIPHPTQNEMNLRLQTFGRPAGDILNEGLEDLIGVCGHLKKVWRKSVKEFQEKNQVSKPSSRKHREKSSQKGTM